MPVNLDQYRRAAAVCSVDGVARGLLLFGIDDAQHLLTRTAEANWAIEILLGRQQKRPVVTAIPARRMQKDQLPAEHTIPLCGNEHRASERPPCSHKEFVVVYLFRDLAEQESLRWHRPCVSETSSSAPPIEAQLIPSACMRSCDRSCGAL